MWTELIASLGPAAGSFIGDLIANGQEDEARALLQQSIDEIGNISIPKLEQLAIQLQGKTNLAGVTENQTAKDAQMSALDALIQRAEAQGLSPQEAAMLAEARGEAESFAKGREGAIGQSMQARGMGDSGLNYVLQQQAAQEQAQRLGQSATQAAGMAAERALEARAMSGQLGGDIREQDWRHKAQVAAGQDAIDKFNTGLTNNKHLYDAQLPAQQFDMEMRKQEAKTGAASSMSKAKYQQAGGTRERAYGYGKMASGVTGSLLDGGKVK